MNILITGSNGFVGSRLMWVLEEKGHEVHGIDNSTHCLREKHPNTIIGDIRKLFTVQQVSMILVCQRKNTSVTTNMELKL